MWLSLGFIGLCIRLAAQGVDAIYLSWVHDPTTTMVIHWHSSDGEWLSRVQLDGKEFRGEYRPLEGTKTTVHIVELYGLSPETLYEFQVDGSDEVFKFKTMPKELKRDIHFVVGGDLYYSVSRFREMGKVVAQLEPDFVVLGGDIAYSLELPRWQAFFRDWRRLMKINEGCLIPMIPVVGNHDVQGKVDPALNTQLFYELFAFPKRYSSVRDLAFGKYLTLFLLDSGHTIPVKGEQTEWLKSSLKKGMGWKIPIYHIAAYPSYYPPKMWRAEIIRNEWTPLFDQEKIPFAFENHNHCFKRTHPLKGGAVDPSGTIYFGDGSWGVWPRSPMKSVYYLAKTGAINMVYHVTLNETSSQVEAIGIDGNPVDDVQYFERN